MIENAKSKFWVNRLIPLGKYVDKEDLKIEDKALIHSFDHSINLGNAVSITNSEAVNIIPLTPDVSAWSPRSLSDQT